MKASDLIKELQDLIDNHGDVTVNLSIGEEVYSVDHLDATLTSDGDGLYVNGFVLIGN